jgi:hypothetical protein
MSIETGTPSDESFEVTTTAEGHAMPERHQEMKTAFDAQDEAMHLLNQEQGLTMLIRTRTEVERAALFEDTAEKCACCMDERLSPPDAAEFRAAGSGILLGKEAAQALWQQAGLTKITSHRGCGAAKVYCQQQGLDVSRADAIAAETLASWAKEIGLPFKELTDLGGQDDYHPARGLVIDGTGRLRLNRVTGMPKLFTVTANADAPLVANDIALAWTIASGTEHAMGQWIDAEHPFVISGLIMSGQEDQFAQIEQAISQLVQSSQGKIVYHQSTIESDSPELPLAA